jgi:hypothetical protein
MHAYLWYCFLRSNTKGYGNKTRQTDSQNSDTTAPSGRQLYQLQFSLQAASLGTFGCTFIYYVVEFLVRYQILSIVTTLWAGRLGFDSRQGQGIFLITTPSRPALESTQHLIHRVPGAFSLVVKRSGREGDESPPSSAEVKNAWNYT